MINDWIKAMPNTIIGLCLAAFVGIACFFIGLVVDSTAWFAVGMIVTQIGTVAALIIGFFLDRRLL